MNNRSELLTLSRIFSAATIKELKTKGKSPLLRALVEQAGNTISYEHVSTIADLFEAVYAVLRKPGNRDEYVYKNALVQKILLGRHSLTTTTIVNEMRAGNSKADLVMYNGTSTAYEVKSERDSLARLTQQINDYRKVFATVNVVTSESYVKAIEELVPADVGIISLSSRYSFHVVREPENNVYRLDTKLLFDALTIPEIEHVLNSLTMQELPEAPNTQIRKKYFEVWSDFNNQELHDEVLKAVKSIRSRVWMEPFISMLPTSLKSSGFAVKFTSREFSRFSEVLLQPAASIRTWS